MVSIFNICVFPAQNAFFLKLRVPMRLPSSLRLLTVASSFIWLSACSEEASVTPPATTSYADELRQALETATPGTIIEIPEGTFEFDRRRGNRSFL